MTKKFKPLTAAEGWMMMTNQACVVAPNMMHLNQILLCPVMTVFTSFHLILHRDHPWPGPPFASLSLYSASCQICPSREVSKSHYDSRHSYSKDKGSTSLWSPSWTFSRASNNCKNRKSPMRTSNQSYPSRLSLQSSNTLNYTPRRQTKNNKSSLDLFPGNTKM